jgi:SAM-dependent methyltransferase
MKAFDYWLQKWRIKVATKAIPGRVRLIDVGAHNGEMFEFLGDRLTEGFGIEPLLESSRAAEKYTLRPGFFPNIRPPTGGWDAISMLAVLEHIPVTQHEELAAGCWELLRPGGLVVITVPSPTVDYVLFALRFLKLIDGMSLEEHFGFQPCDTQTIFAEPRFQLILHNRFQLGLNHLFVFSKRAS